MEVSISIRKIIREDSQMLWEWRNDLISQRNSITTGAVSWEEHGKWFELSLSDNSRQILIGELSSTGEAIGMVRFDYIPNRLSAEVSINLNPAWRGKGYSRLLLSQGIDRYTETMNIDLTASIRPSNTASLKCFSRCGFALEKEDQNFLHYRKARA